MKILLIIFLVFSFYSAKADLQNEVYSVSKVYTKKIALEKYSTLTVSGEKANLKIEYHEGANIELTVKFTAKNKDKETAERDLSIMRYDHTKVKKEIRIGNYYVLDKAQKVVSSVLNVEIILKIPSNLPLTISNQFGNIELINLKQHIQINSEFGKLKLQNCSGEIDAKCKFTDLSSNSSSNITISGNNNDIQLLNHNGIVNLNIEHSDIFIQAIQSVSGQIALQNGTLKIVGLKQEHQKVTIDLKKSDSYISDNYNIIKNTNSTIITSNSNLILQISISYGKVQII